MTALSPSRGPFLKTLLSLAVLGMLRVTRHLPLSWLRALGAALGGLLLRPDRKDEPARVGNLGRIRQWIESAFDTLKDQLSLERHGARTLSGLISRIARRLLALAATLLHNSQLGTPGRKLTAYDH